MANHHFIDLSTPLIQSDVVISTHTNRWVIPFNCEILKALLSEKNIRARDLCFTSAPQCHEFARRLLLLAAEDECRNCRPSQIAELARELIYNKQLTNAA